MVCAISRKRASTRASLQVSNSCWAVAAAATIAFTESMNASLRQRSSCGETLSPRFAHAARRRGPSVVGALAVLAVVGGLLVLDRDWCRLLWLTADTQVHRTDVQRLARLDGHIEAAGGQ